MLILLDAGRAVQVAARIDGERVAIPAADVERALGWTLTPEGLCGEGTCIPVPEGASLGPDDLDLAALAQVLDRPLAVDTKVGAAYLGGATGERRRALRSLHAPDFTLPDLEGRLHSLSDHRGKKVLLVAYASW
jgi:AhpC/TSA family